MLCSAKMADGTWDGNVVEVDFSECKFIRNDQADCGMYTESQRKDPTFKLFVTLSNFNQFSKFLHYRKASEICYKTHTTISTSESSKVETSRRVKAAI